MPERLGSSTEIVVMIPITQIGESMPGTIVNIIDADIADLNKRSDLRNVEEDQLEE